MKRIRLTIEWPGACPESVWADVLKETIESYDVSGLTKVTKVDLVTDFGDTPALTLPDSNDPSLTSHEVRKNRRFGRG
jgi:hypothetical protein